MDGVCVVDNTKRQRATPRRGRRELSEEELTDRRAEIATVALRLFKEEGFPSVSMRRLGREVDLTPMALYRYFPNKRAILSTLWGHILDDAFQEVGAAIHGAQGPDERLRQASHAYVGYWFRNVGHYHLVFMSSGVTNTDVTSFVSQDSVICTYEIFFECVAKALRVPRNYKQVKTATDGLICHLHGIMHSLITMRGYDWTMREDLIDRAVGNAIGR